MIKVISHSYIIGLHELYNFVKYCKYDSGFLESRDSVDFLCLGVGGFGEIEQLLLSSVLVLESLTVTYHIVTCLSVIIRPAIRCIPLQAFVSDVFRSCLRAECSRREAESGTTLYFREVWMWKSSSVRRWKKKTHTIFILCHIVVLTVILNMRWLFVKENEGLVCRSSPAQLTCLWLIHSAGCVGVCVSVSYGF